MKGRLMILGLALAMAMTGCGSMSPTTVVRSGSSNNTSTEAYTMKALNANADFDSLEFEEADLPFEDLTSDYATLGFMDALKKSNKVGYVRSVTDGKFFLATTTGVVFRKDVDIPLEASEAVAVKIAKYLNKKVMVRGPLAGGTLTAERIMSVPDLSVITDILSKGRVAGEAYEDSTKTALSDASIKLISMASGKIYRTTSNKKGNYHISRLEAGNYTLQASKAGYSSIQMQVTITRRKKTEQNLAMAQDAE